MTVERKRERACGPRRVDVGRAPREAFQDHAAGEMLLMLSSKTEV